MKANEFVKKHGLEEARRRLSANNPSKLDMYYYGWGFYTIELKRLVESHDLVESLGGLEKAKELLVEVANRDYKYAQDFEKPALEKAIADVEACQ